MMETLAPGTTAPFWSLTVPEIFPESVCANAVAANIISTATAIGVSTNRTREFSRNIKFSSVAAGSIADMTYTDRLVTWETATQFMSTAVRRKTTGERLQWSEREVNLML